MSHPHPSPHLPEEILRRLWHHQEFDTSALQTTDGRKIEVIFPGISNPNGGPDFLDASIRIGGTLYSGSVELHRTYRAWLQHAHHLDSKYNRVILHVVYDGTNSDAPPVTKSKRSLPVLVLAPYLNPTSAAAAAPENKRERREHPTEIPCRSQSDGAEPGVIVRWLRKLAMERIERKVRRFDERLKELAEEFRRSVHEPAARYREIQFGLNPEELPSPERAFATGDLSRSELWEQLLYEGMMEALGYSKNQQSFLRLAQNATLRVLRNGRHTPQTHNTDSSRHPLLTESILFSVAGLLPPRGTKLDAPSMKRVRRLRSLWRTTRRDYHNELLTAADWQFFRLRPENFPTVRLAGAARLADEILAGRLLKSIVRIAKEGESAQGKMAQNIIRLLVVDADDFWAAHYRFGEQAGAPVRHLIGKSRARDIALNVVIPLCLLYARTFKDKDVRHGTLTMFESFPRLSENVVTRCIRKQLLKERVPLANAMLQQGAIHLFKSYCSAARCPDCAIGRSVFR